MVQDPTTLPADVLCEGSSDLDLPWINCKGCGSHLFKATLTSGTVIEILCKKADCKKVNRIRFEGVVKAIAPDGLGGYVTV